MNVILFQSLLSFLTFLTATFVFGFDDAGNLLLDLLISKTYADGFGGEKDTLPALKVILLF